MAELSYFFNAMETSPGVFDREYQSQDFAEYFGDVLSTGLLHTDKVPGMSVSVETGTLNTIVSTGKAVMRGHRYVNTTPLTLSHSIPEPNLDRIDRVVLRLNLNNSVREIKLRVLEGESSANPVAPTLTRTQFIHDISLAQIRVRANTSSLAPLDLTDERMIEDLCGLVYSLISVPTTVFQQQWDTWFDTQKQYYQENVADWTEEQQTEFLTWRAQEEALFNLWMDGKKDDFSAWVETLEGILSGDVAGNLLTMINAINDSKSQPNGIATLDSEGIIPSEQMPEMPYVPLAEKGVAGGVAQLGSDGRVLPSQSQEGGYLKDVYDNYYVATVSESEYLVSIYTAPPVNGTTRKIVGDENFVYVNSVTTGTIQKFKKSDLKIDATSLDLTVSGTRFGLCIDNDFVYTVGRGTKSIIKYNKNDLSESLSVTIGTSQIENMACDEDFLYLIGSGTSGMVMKYKKSDLSLIATSTTYGGTVYAIEVDDTFVYVGGAQVQVVKKYLKSTMEFVAESANYGGVIDVIKSDGQNIYVGGKAKNVKKYRRSDLAIQLTSATYQGDINAIDVYDKVMYVGGTTPFNIKRYNISDFSLFNGQTPPPPFGVTINGIHVDATGTFVVGETNLIRKYISRYKLDYLERVNQL